MLVFRGYSANQFISFYWRETLVVSRLSILRFGIGRVACTAQKLKFTISSVNVTKPEGNRRFGHIYWRIPSWKTSFFVQCWDESSVLSKQLRWISSLKCLEIFKPNCYQICSIFSITFLPFYSLNFCNFIFYLLIYYCPFKMIINIIDFGLFLTQYLIIRTECTVSSFPKGYHGQR